MIFGGGEEYRVVEKGSVQISFGENMLIFLNVHYVLGIELNLLSVSQIMRHCPSLVINFSNHKCYVVEKEIQKVISNGIRIMDYFD